MWDAQRDAIRDARWLSDFISSSLGPNGLEKILLKDNDDFIITNDGALMIEEASSFSPADQIFAETSKSQRASFGDGAKSVAILGCELLSRTEVLLDRGVHPNTIIRGYHGAAEKTVAFLEGLGRRIDLSDDRLILNIIETSLSSRFRSKNDVQVLSRLMAEAVRSISYRDSSSSLHFNDENIYVKSVIGDTLRDSRLIKGVVIDKEVELDAPKTATNARIALLRVPIEIERTEWDVEVKLRDPLLAGGLLTDECQLIMDKMEKVASTGANVVFCERGIDPKVRQYLKEKSILAVKWIAREDMNRISKATGATIIADIQDLKKSDLGKAEQVEEQSFGDKKVVLVVRCPNSELVTILVRGPTDSIIKEAERSLSAVVRLLMNLFRNPRTVLGGGSTEAELAVKLREYATSLGGKERAVYMTFADALDSIPVALIKNSGGDVLDLLTSLRSRHEKGELNVGVGANGPELNDMLRVAVYEPLKLKANAIRFACEAATAILSIDEVVSAEYSEEKKTSTETTEETRRPRISTRDATRSNLATVKTVTELVKRSFGPKGMMKLLVDNIGDVRATTDGATMLKFLYAKHPVVKLLVEAAESHSKINGDGTKTLVVLVGELVSQAEKLLNQGLQIPAIVAGYDASADLATGFLEKLSSKVNLDNPQVLRRIATAVMHEDLSEDHVSKDEDSKGSEVVETVINAYQRIASTYGDRIADEFDSKKIKMIKKVGAGVIETSLIDGLIIENEVTSGDMPKRIEHAKIAVLDCWLGVTRQSLKRETKILIQGAPALRNYINSSLEISKEIDMKVVSSGSDVVFCSKRTDDVTKRLLANSGIMVIESVSSEDMEALSELTGATIISDLRHLNADHLGKAHVVEERELQGTKLVFVEGCPSKGHTCILIRGGTSSIVNEAERTLRKTIKTLVALSKDPRVVPGGGLSESEVARELKKKAREVSGREQLSMGAFSDALEGITKTLIENAGLSPLEATRKATTSPCSQQSTTRRELSWFKSHIRSEELFGKDIWDPYLQKTQAILNATNVASTILRLGHTVCSKKRKERSETEQKGSTV